MLYKNMYIKLLV